MYPDAWHALQDVMNFTYELSPPPTKSWGNLKNGSWDGIVAMLLRDEVGIYISHTHMYKL